MADDYWCVVALSYSREEAFIVEQSDEILNADIFYDALDYLQTIGDDWKASKRPPGLYRLTFTVPLEEGSSEDDPILEFDNWEVTNVECLVEFPPLLAATVDDYAGINRRMAEIAKSEGR